MSLLIEAIVAQRHERGNENTMVLGLINTVESEIFFLALITRRSAALSFVTQHAMPL